MNRLVPYIVVLLAMPSLAGAQSSTLPNLSAATAAADADLLLIRKSGETRDKKITKANLFAGVALGPASVCSDNQIARFDGASATQLQCSVVTIADTTGAMTVDGAGAITANAGGFYSNSGGFNVATITRLGGDSLTFRNSGYIGWSADGAECSGTACDSGLKRSAAGVVKVTDGGSGLGSLSALGLTATGAMVMPPTVKTTSGAYNVGANDYIVVINKASGEATTVNLPGSPATGRVLIVKDGKGDAAANNITLTPAAGTIDGGASVVITSNYGSVAIVYNGTQWNVI